MSSAIRSNRLVSRFVAERGRDVLGDAFERVAAQLERLHQLLLGIGEIVGRVEALDALQQLLGRAAVGGDLGLEVELGEVVGRFQEAREEPARELIRGGDDRVQVGDEVLEATFLAGVEAAADPEQEQDHDEHTDAQRDQPPHQQLALAIGPRSSWATAARGRI